MCACREDVIINPLIILYMYCMHRLILMLHLDNVEMKALKHEVFHLSNTKNELCGEIHCYKQSLKSVEETLVGR